MKRKLEIRGLVMEGGTMSKANSANIRAFLDANIGSVITITMNAGKKRSNPQNAYYWGGVVPFVQSLFADAGHDDFTANDVHEFLKKEFNWQEIEVNGNYVTVPKSTTELSTSDFNEYIERINRFCLDMFGAAIPQPNEQMAIFK